MLWRGHCQLWLLSYFSFGTKVTKFALFRHQLTKKRDDCARSIAWANKYVHAAHEYATWHLVWCSCAELLRLFKISILAATSEFWYLSLSLTENLENDHFKATLSYSPRHALSIDAMLGCVMVPPRAPRPQIWNCSCLKLFNLNSPQQTAHSRSNATCMHSTQCMLSAGATITINDWFIVELELGKCQWHEPRSLVLGQKLHNSISTPRAAPIDPITCMVSLGPVHACIRIAWSHVNWCAC